MRVLDHGPYEAPGSVLMVASFKGSRRVLWRFRLWVCSVLRRSLARRQAGSSVFFFVWGAGRGRLSSSIACF